MVKNKRVRKQHKISTAAREPNMPGAQNKSRQPVKATACVSSGEDRTRTSAVSCGNNAVSFQSGAESGAVGSETNSDHSSIAPQLARLIAAWPSLSDATRDQFIALIDAEQPGASE